MRWTEDLTELDETPSSEPTLTIITGGRVIWTEDQAELQQDLAEASATTPHSAAANTASFPLEVPVDMVEEDYEQPCFPDQRTKVVSKIIARKPCTVIPKLSLEPHSVRLVPISAAKTPVSKVCS